MSGIKISFLTEYMAMAILWLSSSEAEEKDGCQKSHTGRYRQIMADWQILAD